MWTDWQSAGVGSPATDLAFPSLRAVPDGARLPPDAIRAEYAELRGLAVSDVASAAIAAKLAIFLVGWLPYAVFDTAAGVDLVHQRGWRRSPIRCTGPDATGSRRLVAQAANPGEQRLRHLGDRLGACAGHDVPASLAKRSSHSFAMLASSSGLITVNSAPMDPG